VLVRLGKGQSQVIRRGRTICRRQIPLLDTVECVPGAGIEGAFSDHWTARIEYLFVDLQNATTFVVSGQSSYIDHPQLLTC